MFNYGRIFCVFLSLVVALAALFLQLLMSGLGAGSSGAFPASLGIQIIMFIGGLALAMVFLICIFGGVRLALFATGWMLVLQFLLCALSLLLFCDPAPGALWDRHPDTTAGAFGVAALALSAALVRKRGPTRRRAVSGLTAEGPGTPPDDRRPTHA